MSVSHLAITNNNSVNYANLPINSVYAPAISTGLLLESTNVLSSATAISPTAAQMPGGIFYTATGTTSTFTPPTANAMYLYCVGQGGIPGAGDSFTFTIINSNSGTLTMASATGVTYLGPVGSGAVATGTTRILRVRFIDSTNCVIYG